MTVPKPSRAASPVQSNRWTWAAVLLSAVLCYALYWQHDHDQRTIDFTERTLGSLREARIDLAQGFIDVLIGREAAAEPEFKHGLEKLDRAAQILAEANHDGQTPPELAVFTQQMPAFRDSVARWSERPGGPQIAPDDPLHVEFHALDALAMKADDASAAGLRALSERLDERFAFTLSAAIALLSAVCIGLYLANRGQAAAIQALHEGEERLRMLGDNLPDGYVYQYILDGRGPPRFTYLSAGVERLHGVSPEAALRDPSELLNKAPPAQRTAILAAEKAASETLTNFELDVEFPNPDGTVRLVHMRSHPRALSGDTILWDGIAIDVTERRQAQVELEKANARYALQEAALSTLTRACAVREMGIPELIVHVTQVAADTLGADRASVWRSARGRQTLTCRHVFARPQSGPSESPSPHGELPVYFRALFDGQVLAVANVDDDPLAADLHRGGWIGPRTRAALGTPIHSAGGVSGLFLAEQLDTARPWTSDEQAFAVAIANLISLLIEVEERQLIEGQLRQAQKMEAIGQLAGGVAHDFNNILAAMMMQAELAGSAPDLPEDTREGLAEILTATERAANLTRQLLLFSRRQVMQPRVLDLNDVVTQLAKMLQRIIGEDVPLKLLQSPRPLLTRADPGMLDQVLMNLAVNARDAMPDGGELRIETTEHVVDEAQTRFHPDAVVGTYVRLSVCDSGTGIAAANLSRIFEPFFTTKEPGKGTGLGLATVFGIVRQHNGWMKVDSELGRGTSFHIYLPTSAQSGSEGASTAVAVRRTGNGETILIVEDESAVRGVTREVLLRHGYSVIEAPNGREALTLWRERQEEISVLLTDLVMPGGVNGLQLARQVLAERPTLKVIYMSGYSAEVAGAEQTLRVGENFLQKPFGPVQLLDAVWRALG